MAVIVANQEKGSVRTKIVSREYLDLNAPWGLYCNCIVTRGGVYDEIFHRIFRLESQYRHSQLPLGAVH